MRKEIALLAGPRGWGMTRASWLARVVEKVPTVSHRTVKGLWYGEITDENHWAARDIRRAVQAQQEAANLATQLDAIVQGLQATDPAIYQSTVAALISAVGKLRGGNQS